MQDPEEFVREVDRADTGDLLKLWSRSDNRYYLPSVTDEIVTRAFSALDRFTTETLLDDNHQRAVKGSLFALGRRIQEEPSEAQALCRNLAARYFHGENSIIAFMSVRQFEVYLPRYTLFVSDHLVRVASKPLTRPVPCIMSLRAMAFKILLDLDGQFQFWPQLAVARRECLAACLEWGAEGLSSSLHYQQIADQLVRYCSSEK